MERWRLSVYLTLALGILLGGLGIYLEIRYAWANYPGTRGWRLLLFLVFFGAGASFATVIVIGTSEVLMAKAVFVTAMGCAFGLLFTFAFPRNVQHVIPKRKDPPEST